MKIIAAVLLAVGCAGASAHSAQSERPESIRNVHRIVCLGDSITQGGGPPNGYVYLLDRYLNTLYGAAEPFEVVNAGISGQKAPDMQARFQRDVIDKKPDLVTISVGVNDVWHAYRDFANGIDHPNGDLPAGIPLPRYRENLVAMIDAAKAAKIKVVLLAPTLIYENLASPENQRLTEYIHAMRQVARDHDCIFVDLNAPFRDTIREYQKHAGRAALLLTVDGVHMNPAGNHLMAYTVLRGLGVPEAEIVDLKVK